MRYIDIEDIVLACIFWGASVLVIVYLVVQAL